MLSTLSTLVPYLVRYRWRFAAGFLAMAFRVAFAAAVPLALSWAVDALAAGAAGRRLLPFAGLLVALSLSKAVFHYFQRRLLIGVSRDIEYDLRHDLVGRLLALPQRFYLEHRVGDLMSRSINDLAAWRMLLGPGLMYLVERVGIFVVTLTVMAATDWRLTALVFLPLPGVSLTVQYFGRKTHHQFRDVQARLSDISAMVEQHVRQVRMLRAYAQQRPEAQRFGALNDAYVDGNLGLVEIWRRFYPQMELLISATYAVILGYGGFAALQGRITIGDFVMFLSYAALLTWPMISFGWVINLFERGAASLERLNELLRYPLSIADGPKTDSRIDSIRGDIGFDNVSVYYPGADEPALAEVSFYAPAGSSLAIVGPIGAGKTTLLNLIPRLLDPQHGRVLVDGIDVRRIPLAVLRQAVGYATQESFLFSRSMAENLRFGAPWAQAWEIEEASGIAQIWDDIADFADGFETPVGERGVTLSGGQRQRTALTRALLRDPRVLILDDTLSNVDAETESQILDRLRVFLRNRTTLIVSNRTRAARLADHILALDKGRIVEAGSHDELLARGGFYADLHRRSRLEEELVRDE